MAGLVPKRRTRNELERANETLLERHKDHLRTWVEGKKAAFKSQNKKTEHPKGQSTDCRQV